MPANGGARVYEFGDFRIDARQGRLWRRDGTPVSLTPRLFDALLFFVERPGELLDKSTLIAALWPGLVVEDNNLNQTIAGVRRALGDGPQGSLYIQTVPRRGFRFVAEVTPLATVPGAGSAEPPPVAPAEPVPPTAAPAEPPARPAPTPVARTRRPHPRWAWILAAAATALLLAVATAWQWRERNAAITTTDARVTQIAVLPFKPLVISGRDEALELGMADSLIARLSALPGVAVRSFGSVRRYGGAEQDPMSAARELQVDWLIDGTVQRSGDQVRVTARLLRASDGSARWSGSFDERFTGVFQVQDAIASRVADVIAPSLTTRDRTRMTASGTRNTDAYQLYLAARLQAQGIRPAGLRKSIELYRKAIDLDPQYALAYAGLAESYRRLPFGADAAPTEAFEPARAAAQRAIDLDPALAEGYAELGWIKFWYEWDWPGAEQAFLRALELNPNASEAHLGLGHFLSAQGRGDEGFPHIQRARELDPMSLIANTLEAGYLLGRGQRDEANQRIRQALDLDPEFWVAHLTMASFQLADDDPAGALASLRRAEQNSEGSTQATAMIGYVLARTGHRDDAQAVLERLLGMSRQRYVPPTSIATVYCGLGDKDKTLEWLARAYDVRDLRLAFLKVDGRWGAVRDDPRFAELLEKLKLDTGSTGKAAH